MDINEYRKQLFIKSQYCTYYKVNNNTVLAGIIRDKGYRYAVNLPEEKLKDVNRVYRRFTTLLNSAVAVELILYIYLVIFPYYTQFMHLPFWTVVILLSLIPLIALYLTYIIINSLYENYLTRYVGTFQRMKFQPKVKYIEDKVFEEYIKTPRKSIYVLVILFLIFFSYVTMPLIVNSFNSNNKFNSALRLSNFYLALVPVAPEVYSQRAYAKFNLKQYKEAVEDYKKANEYSFSDDFNADILGVKTYYLPYKQVLKEFDNMIETESDKPYKYYLMSEKATFMLKNKDYKAACELFNYLINIYQKGDKVFFSPSAAYYNRGVARANLGDKSGANSDSKIAQKMCPECQFKVENTLVRKPL